MREIKFRAWDKADKKWLYGYEELGGFSLIGETVLMGEFGSLPLKKLCEDVVIMQFTGLKDKNGKEIYEGDVVQLYFYDNYKNYTFKYEKAQVWVDKKHVNDIKEVKFIQGSFVIWSDLIKDYRPFCNLARPGNQLEIIGNIYQNPELINPSLQP